VAVAVAVALGSGGIAHAQLEEIFVTGSRISRDGFDAPTPVTAIDNDYLLDLGMINVGAAIQQLPINKASLTPETNGFGSFNVGAQIVNLRALGSNAVTDFCSCKVSFSTIHGGHAAGAGMRTTTWM
jgi:hypothetical protein